MRYRAGVGDCQAPTGLGQIGIPVTQSGLEAFILRGMKRVRRVLFSPGI